MGTSLMIKTYATGFILSLLGSIKTYSVAAYLFIKPIFIYTIMRFTWLFGIACVEWWSGRLYSINCIGEGINGFYNHIFQIASPACTGLLTTHIGLMGVLVATFLITCMWGLFNMMNQIKNMSPGKQVIKEYEECKNMINKNN